MYPRDLQPYTYVEIANLCVGICVHIYIYIYIYRYIYIYIHIHLGNEWCILFLGDCSRYLYLQIAQKQREREREQTASNLHHKGSRKLSGFAWRVILCIYRRDLNPTPQQAGRSKMKCHRPKRSPSKPLLEGSWDVITTYSFRA